MTHHYEQGHDDAVWVQQQSRTFSLAYVDICDGHLHDAVIFGQIMYWHGMTDTGATRLRVRKMGKMWLAKTYDDWWVECRINASTARKSLGRIEKLGLIEKRVWKFNGSPTVHIRVNFEKYREMITALRAKQADSKCDEMTVGSATECQNDMLPQDTSITETTAENTIKDSASKSDAAAADETSQPQPVAALEEKTTALWRIGEYHDLVCDAFVVSGYALGRKIAQVLSCEYKKRDAWQDAQPPTPISLEEMREFAKWYKAKSEAKHRQLRDPVKIQDAVCEYRAHATNQATAAARLQAQREQARVEEAAFVPMTDAERREVEARFADEARALGRRVGYAQGAGL